MNSRREFSNAVSALVLILWTGLVAVPAHAVDDVDLHELNWYVHVDLVTVMNDLAYWQNVLDAQAGLASDLIEGAQGPADTPCCSRISRSIAVSTFGSPGDGYDIIDSESERDNLNGLAGTSGSNAFLVDSITYCSGPGQLSVGCAIQPGCTGNGGDDPNTWMAVTVDAFDSSTLPIVIAHERGHNACLGHTGALACQVMQGTVIDPGQGGCFTNTECSNFRDGRTTTLSGLECSCHASGGVIEPEATICNDAPLAYCSGGLCGDDSTDALVQLLASAHAGSAAIPAPDDALTISPLTGNWSDIGQIGAMAEDVHGMAYGSDSDTLYGVVPTSGNDSIVTMNQTTGDLIAVVGSIANGPAEMISMAYHPGATSSPADDRLIMMEVTGENGTIVWVDPASPSVRNVYGGFPFTDAGLFRGLAYDSAVGRLFASSPYGMVGLYEIDLSSCPPSFWCLAEEVSGPNYVAVDDGSLTYSPLTGMLYQVGTDPFVGLGTRTFYNVIDPSTGASPQTISLDVFTPGALAAVPEPSRAVGLLMGCAGLLWMGSRRHRAA